MRLLCSGLREYVTLHVITVEVGQVRFGSKVGSVICCRQEEMDGWILSRCHIAIRFLNQW